MNGKFKVECTCNTCEFNSGGVCIGGDATHAYGKVISDINASCSGWGESFEYFMEIENKAPWYIKNPYRHGNAYGKNKIALLQMDYNNEPIDVDLYALIERMYSLNCHELAEVLGVSVGVVDYAKMHGTPEKRKAAFSAILHIPIQYFDRTTTLDFSDFEKYRDSFLSAWKVELPKIKETAHRKQEEKSFQSSLALQSNLQQKAEAFLIKNIKMPHLHLTI